MGCGMRSIRDNEGYVDEGEAGLAEAYPQTSHQPGDTHDAQHVRSLGEYHQGITHFKSEIAQLSLSDLCHKPSIL
jgi:hypothetical protein